MINEFKYGQTWKIWSSLLGLSLYNPFKALRNSFIFKTLPHSEFWHIQNPGYIQNSVKAIQNIQNSVNDIQNAV